MRFLCLIHLDERALSALPPAELDALNAAHLDLNDELRASKHLIEAEALEPARTTVVVRARPGQKTTVTDGPYAEAKEMIAGFYLLEARDMEEATAIAARLPGGRLGYVEVRQVRKLVVPGRDD